MNPGHGPDTTVGATHGISSTPVQKPRQRMRVVSTSAMTIPSTSFTATDPPVNTKLFITARRKNPSDVSRM